MSVLFSGAQNRKKDSLVEKLNTCREDTQKIKILNKLALLLYTTKQDEARNYGNQALELAKKTSLKKEEALSYKILGTINYFNGDFFRAKDFYMNALNLSIEEGDSLQMGNCYRNVGLACEHISGKRESVDYYFKALGIAERLRDSARISNLYNDIGNSLFTLGDYKAAITYYKKSYVLESRQQNEHGRAIELNNIGSAFAQQNNLDSGLKYHLMAFDIRVKINDLAGLVTSYSNIADYHIKKAEFGKALETNLKCLAVAKQLGEKDNIARAMHALMNNYIQLHDYKKARLFGDTAKRLSYGTGYINTLKEIFLSSYELNVATGNYKEALNDYRNFINYRDSLINDDVIKKVTEAQMKFDYEKEKEKTRLEQEAKDNLTAERAKKQNIVRNLLVGGFVLLLILVVFILRGYREKQKANKIIMHQKHLVEEKQKEIVDSIKYAQRIQKSLMPTDKYIERVLKNNK